MYEHVLTDDELLAAMEPRTGLSTVAGAARLNGSLRGITKAVFLRSSVAYGDEDALAPVAANLPRYEPVTLVGAMDGSVQVNEISAGVHIAPLCLIPGATPVLLGTSTADISLLYQSTDGSTWTRVHPFIGVSENTMAFDAVWATAGGRVIVVLADATYKNLYYCDSWVSTPTPATIAFVVANVDASALPRIPYTNVTFGTVQNGFAEVGGGCLFLGIYGTPSDALIYRSLDNGATWATSYDPGAGAVTHWHSLGYHAATGIVVAIAGDVGLKRMVYTTTPLASGNIWTVRVIANWQPTYLGDFGDADNLVFGDDGPRLAGTFNARNIASAFPLYKVPFVFDRSQEGAGWSIFQYAGVYYIANATTSLTYAGDREPAVLATVDWVHYAVAFHFTQDVGTGNYGIMRWLGLCGGKLHAKLIGGNNPNSFHFSMTPISLRTISAPVVEPPATNLLTTAARSSFEGTIGDSGWSAGGAHTAWEIVTSTHFGDPAETRCVHLNFTAGATNGINSPLYDGSSTGVAAGDVVQGHMRLKASVPTNLSMALYKTAGTPAFVASKPVTVGTEWAEFSTLPYLCAGTGDIGVSLSLVPSGVDIYADYAAVYKIADASSAAIAPHMTYQIGGTARAAETLESASVRPAAWTEVFHVFPRFHRKDIALATGALTGNLYVRHWVTRGGYLVLYYNTSDRKFYLAENVAGGGETAITGAVTLAQDWWKNYADLKFAVTYDGTSAGLWLLNGVAAIDGGSGVRTLADARNAVVQSGPGGTNGTTTFGTTLFPQTLGPVVVFDSVLDAAGIAAAMNRTELP